MNTKQPDQSNRVYKICRDYSEWIFCSSLSTYRCRCYTRPASCMHCGLQASLFDDGFPPSIAATTTTNVYCNNLQVV